MSKHYVVSDTEQRSFTYPANQASMNIVKMAGGVSKLSQEHHAMVSFKTVGPGEDCSDMPASSLEIYLARGWVKEVEPKAEKVGL